MDAPKKAKKLAIAITQATITQLIIENLSFLKELSSLYISIVKLFK